MHDIEATRVKIYFPPTILVKALYPTYSHYLESLQANGKLKEISFDSLVEKFAEREKDFGKKRQFLNLLKKLCSLHRKRRIGNKIILEEEVAEEDVERRIVEVGGTLPRRKT